jgi:hypothetical protein
MQNSSAEKPVTFGAFLTMNFYLPKKLFSDILWGIVLMQFETLE